MRFVMIAIWYHTNDSRSSTSSQTLTQTYDDRHASSLKNRGFNLDRRFLLVEPLCGLRVDLPYMKKPAYAAVRTSFTSSDSVVNIAL